MGRDIFSSSNNNNNFFGRVRPDYRNATGVIVKGVIQPTANLNVTAWNPLPALAIFAFGKRTSFVFSYAAGLSLSDWLIRGNDPSGAESITLTLINAACYLIARLGITRYAIGFNNFNNFKTLIGGLTILIVCVYKLLLNCNKLALL